MEVGQVHLRNSARLDLYFNFPMKSQFMRCDSFEYYVLCNNTYFTTSYSEFNGYFTVEMILQTCQEWHQLFYLYDLFTCIL